MLECLRSMSGCKGGEINACVSPKRKLRSLDSRFLIHAFSCNGVFTRDPLLPSPLKRPRRRINGSPDKTDGKLLDDEVCSVSGGLSQDAISCDDTDGGDVSVVAACDRLNACSPERPSSLDLIAAGKLAVAAVNGVADALSTAANNVTSGIPWLTSSVGRPKSTLQPASPGGTGAGVAATAPCSSSPASPFVAHHGGSTSGDGSSSAVSSPNISCHWEGCAWSQTLASPEDLHDHMLTRHVTPQSLSKRRKYFMCLWSECRLFKVSSLSFSWLERHILEHSGAQPYVCIFYPACRQRLATQVLLERHVQRAHLACDFDNGQHSRNHQNHHRNNNISNNSNSNVTNSSSLITPSSPLSSTNVALTSSMGTSLSRQTSVSTMARKGVLSSKKKRRRRRIRPFRVHSIDFFDSRTQHCLQDANRMLFTAPDRAMDQTFMALRAFPHVIVGRRVMRQPGCAEGRTDVLVRFPSRSSTILEEWISEADYRSLSDYCSS